MNSGQFYPSETLGSLNNYDGDTEYEEWLVKNEFIFYKRNCLAGSV